jgi:SAM-dependent methyltransferase
VDTRQAVPLADLTVVGSNKGHGHRYEPARAAIVRKLLPRLKALLPENSTFVDLGSGKGRVLMLAAEAGFAGAKGIEFAADLCRIARANCDSFQKVTGSSCRFEIIEIDAALYIPSETDNIFFLFNPFDAVILRAVLDNIQRSLETFPRKIYICYYNPAFGESAEEHPTFHKELALEFWGYRFKVYASA